MRYRSSVTNYNCNKYKIYSENRKLLVMNPFSREIFILRCNVLYISNYNMYVHIMYIFFRLNG